MTDAKSQLNKFLQTILKRPISKQDLVYTVTKFNQGFQATLVCQCFEDGYEFVGEIGKDSKEAEKLAAQQALEVYLDTYGEQLGQVMLEKAQSKNKGKGKGKSIALEEVVNQFRISEAPPEATPESEEVPGVKGQEPKSRLMNFLQRYLKRPVTKNDLTYSVEKYDEGYQATLVMNCFDGHVVTGEVAGTAKEAEFTAADLALKAYQEEIGDLPPSANTLKKQGERTETQNGWDSYALKGAAGGKDAYGKSAGKGKGKFGYDGQFGKGKDFGYGGYDYWNKGKGFGYQQWPAKGAWHQQAAAGDSFAAEWSPSLGPPIALTDGKGGGGIGKNDDAKSRLARFLQKAARRPLTKEEVAYQVVAAVGGGFQATLTLSGCVEEVQVFEGGVGRTEKEAEKLVAQEALNAYAEQVDSIEALPKKKKQKRSADDLGMGLSGEPPAKRIKEEMLGETPPPRKTEKTELNAACMKILRRPLTKGEIIYDTQQVPVEGTMSSYYQCTASLSFLQDSGGQNAWTGEAYASKPDAEHSAAGVALAAILAVPEYVELFNAPKASQQRQMMRKGGKGEAGNGFQPLPGQGVVL